MAWANASRTLGIQQLAVRGLVRVRVDDEVRDERARRVDHGERVVALERGEVRARHRLDRVDLAVGERLQLRVHVLVLLEPPAVDDRLLAVVVGVGLGDEDVALGVLRHRERAGHHRLGVLELARGLGVLELRPHLRRQDRPLGHLREHHADRLVVVQHERRGIGRLGALEVAAEDLPDQAEPVLLGGPVHDVGDVGGVQRLAVGPLRALADLELPVRALVLGRPLRGEVAHVVEGLRVVLDQERVQVLERVVRVAVDGGERVHRVDPVVGGDPERAALLDLAALTAGRAAARVAAAAAPGDGERGDGQDDDPATCVLLHGSLPRGPVVLEHVGGARERVGHPLQTAVQLLGGFPPDVGQVGRLARAQRRELAAEHGRGGQVADLGPRQLGVPGRVALRRRARRARRRGRARASCAPRARDRPRRAPRRRAAPARAAAPAPRRRRSPRAGRRGVRRPRARSRRPVARPRARSGRAPGAAARRPRRSAAATSRRPRVRTSAARAAGSRIDRPRASAASRRRP